jgi:Methylamine utilization protein MauJ
MTILSTTEKLRVRGVPGEEQNLLVVFSTTDFPMGSRPISVPGSFRVQFLLARPGHLKFSETEPSFLTKIVGDSHIGITKPIHERNSDKDIIGMVLNTRGGNWQLQFNCVVNDAGYLGKIVVELPAKDYIEAEAVAFRALTPFLSAWSVTLDVPVNIETIQVTDLTTHTDMLRIQSPFIEMKPAGGVTTALSEEFCQFASLYREGMNANSPFYRFLCFYKVVESIYLRRSETAKRAKLRGEIPRKYDEDVPLTKDAMKVFWSFCTHGGQNGTTICLCNN